MDPILVLDVVGDMAVDCHTLDIATLEGFVFWIVYRSHSLWPDKTLEI